VQLVFLGLVLSVKFVQAPVLATPLEADFTGPVQSAEAFQTTTKTLDCVKPSKVSSDKSTTETIQHQLCTHSRFDNSVCFPHHRGGASSSISGFASGYESRLKTMLEVSTYFEQV
jgi:hypothetical protein